ncbi:Malolactic regulator [Lacticaseibacillus rhamnosus]|uniref:Malolactic regulator n=1 Tax=Lacticaseibacillus rhamnosus TaxID=47715 RepID=A0AAP8LXA8_LACRH|nr:Malolactic regulator [Lacticaseibacillus rhamnosus]PTM24573.1 Malolactic regulator [Lacticaseibacillus rhamnosus]TXK02405.1 Malolactic regulator [Lacticaseibacillus rhamnosus]
MGWAYSKTRSPAQRSACKDLRRNGQKRALTSKATCVLAYAHNALTGVETCV